MFRSLPSLLICISLGMSLVVPAAAQVESAAVIQYTAERVPLGFTPTAMNNRGWIVGRSSSNYPMRYRPGVGTEQISDKPGRLYDINDAGTAVGYLELDGRREAIMRPAGAPWKRLGTLTAGHSIAYAINEAGQIAGVSTLTLEDPHIGMPFIYTEAEGMRRFSDYTYYPLSINDAGQIVEMYQGRLWDPVLGTVGLGIRACCIARNGTVAGKHYNNRQLATYSPTNGVRVIGEAIPSTAKDYFPTAINGRAWITGYRMGKAFLYVYGQGIRDLDALLVTPLPQPLTHAIGINDRDEILARTSDPIRYYILKRVR